MVDAADETTRLPRAVYAAVDRAVRGQQPTVASYVERLRRRRPGATPWQVVQMLDRQYLAAVTGTGAAIGGTAAAPGVGTGAALALSVGETLTFLETSAIYVLAVAEVHGVQVEDVERRRTLLLAVLMGESGAVLLEKAAGRGTQHWAKLLPGSIPRAAVEQANRTLAKWVVRRYGARQGAVVLGRLVPFGVGAAIGGAANAAIGKGIIASVGRAFGPPPEQFAHPLPPTHREITGEVVDAAHEARPGPATSWRRSWAR